MSDNDPRAPKNQRPNGGDPQFNWRGLVFFAVTVALLGGAFLFRGGSLLQNETLTYPVFEQLVAGGKVLATPDRPIKYVVEQGSPTQYLTGFYKKPVPASATPIKADKSEPTEEATPFRVDVFAQLNGDDVKKLLADAKLPYTVVQETNLLATTIVSFLPIASSCSSSTSFSARRSRWPAKAR